MKKILKYLAYALGFSACVFALVVSVIKYGLWLTFLWWIALLFVTMGLVWVASKLFRFLISKDEDELDY